MHKNSEELCSLVVKYVGSAETTSRTEPAARLATGTTRVSPTFGFSIYFGIIRPIQLSIFASLKFVLCLIKGESQPQTIAAASQGQAYVVLFFLTGEQQDSGEPSLRFDLSFPVIEEDKRLDNLNLDCPRLLTCDPLHYLLNPKAVHLRRKLCIPPLYLLLSSCQRASLVLNVLGILIWYRRMAQYVFHFSQDLMTN